MEKQLTLEKSRIKNALQIHNSEPLPKILSVHDLKALAKFTNAAPIHYSGNCVLLATCLYYNLFKGQKILSVKNISNPLTGLDSDLVEMMIFGHRMTTLATVNSLSKITVAILKEYSKTRGLYYKIVAYGYKVPIIGELGHDFNAVVIMDGRDGRPRVVYVDAWKTSQYVATEEMMVKRFFTGAKFDLKIIPFTVARNTPVPKELFPESTSLPLQRQGACRWPGRRGRRGL